MIISYSRNFIYIRTRKTASSTIKRIFCRDLAAEDLSLGKHTAKFPTHLRATEVIPIVPAEFWVHAFKFTSERHPYEKAVSLAAYNYGKQTKLNHSEQPEFPIFLNNIVCSGRYRSFDYYSIDGKVVVDEFIRFETLLSDLKRIGGRLGIPVPNELPHAKMSARDPRPAQEILNDEQKQIVFQHCREEFELHGYER
ncbi:MAG TPA: hypothetical protein VHW69_01335 [Rhizomicrobium sp.]|nr:hypothetical protein [Rhizomicrobium sp.]